MRNKSSRKSKSPSANRIRLYLLKFIILIFDTTTATCAAEELQGSYSFANTSVINYGLGCTTLKERQSIWLRILSSTPRIS